MAATGLVKEGPARWVSDQPDWALRPPLTFDKSDAGKEAEAAIKYLLFIPEIANILCNATNFSFKGPVLAKIDRAKFGDRHAFLPGSLIVAQYKGQLIIDDWGFYGRKVDADISFSFGDGVREKSLAISHCERVFPRTIVNDVDKLQCALFVNLF